MVVSVSLIRNAYMNTEGGHVVDFVRITSVIVAICL